MTLLTRSVSWLAPRLLRRHEYGFRRALRCPERAQAELLWRISKKLAGSAVARQTGLFPGIDLAALRALPLTRSTAWAQQLEADARGRPTFGNEPVLTYALTSGTSSAPKKFPVTGSFVRTWQQLSKTMLLSEGAARGFNLLGHALSHRNLMLMATPEATPARGGALPEGYSSGLTAQFSPWVMRRQMVPSPEVLRLPTWEQKFTLLCREAPRWDLGSITGLPAVLREFLSRARQATGRPLAQVWPHLRVVLVGGGALSGELRAHVQELFGSSRLEFLETYFATEGQFGHSLGDPGAGLVLNPQAAHFQFVDPRSGQRLALHEVTPGFEGLVVLTTLSGLVNYQLGDLVRVRSVGPVRVQLVGRENEELSICGDKLSRSHCAQAVARALGAEEAPWFAVWVEGRRLVFALDATGRPTAEVAHAIDAALREANPVYRENRANDVLAQAVRLEPLERRQVERYFQRNLDRGQFKGRRLFASRAAFEEELHAGP